MGKLIKTYLKPFRLMLVLAILLLFGQAVCDLNLPNIMSDIINIGIMQGGVERATPQAVSQNGMQLSTAFMTDSEKQLVSDNYILVKTTDTNAKGKTYASIYPKAEDSLYVLNTTDKTVLKSLDGAFEDSGAAFVNIMQAMAKQSGQDLTDTLTSSSVDITQAYQFLPQLPKMPPDTIASAEAAAASSPEMLKTQSSIAITKAYLNELGYDTNGMQQSSIWKYGLIMLLVALLSGAATCTVTFLATRVATGAARSLRRSIFTKVSKFSNTEFDKFPTATLITRNTNDVMQLQMLLMFGIRMIIYAPIVGVGAVIMALNKAVSMTWIIALVVVILLCMIFTIVRVAVPKFKIMQKLVDKLNLVSRESLSGMMVIRAFGTQEHEAGRFDQANTNMRNTSRFINRTFSFMFPIMTLIMNGMAMLVIWVGANRIAASSIQIGDMMAFMQYAFQVMFAFLSISMIFMFVPRASVAADRINEVLDTDISIKDPEDPKEFAAAKKGVVEFKHVNFHYNGASEDALSDINFTALPGQTTAIIGATGSGKTTAINLLLRFYDVTGGEINVDGVDIRQARMKDLRARIGYVPQKGVLLSGTIESNLRYGNRAATDEEVEKVAEVAQAIGFIKEKEEGFDAEISQGGTNVSGGQKQRLSIARALAKNPEVLVFDDSFSALDFKTDAVLRKALKEHTADATVIIVAQRVGTIMSAEQILVMDQGRIVGRGTHKELMQNCPEYIEIAMSQLSKEELA
ncbi:MAG: ABC transporter ATP-binding protein/permease [Defluviitaleaceae bacterium]|nr:ABC transporter ATP-binding protein/permease [Defluviitaleaceae bacterium]